jgi:hypothetical protein
MPLLWKIVSYGAMQTRQRCCWFGTSSSCSCAVMFLNSVAPEVLSLEDQRFCERYRFHGLLLSLTQS